ncbi:protein KASH5 [Trichechus manatus latirostris]|uniref:Protein KASH5 n=1 Tax=Trichechus manatus latirostris TaxID=127582 RepID=A0A2Y9DVH4_TRIMA|nr:protein KASH5 [Trichechus manatus latirostris]
MAEGSLTPTVSCSGPFHRSSRYRKRRQRRVPSLLPQPINHPAFTLPANGHAPAPSGRTRAPAALRMRDLAVAGNRRERRALSARSALAPLEDWAPPYPLHRTTPAGRGLDAGRALGPAPPSLLFFFSRGKGPAPPPPPPPAQLLFVVRGLRPNPETWPQELSKQLVPSQSLLVIVVKEGWPLAMGPDDASFASDMQEGERSAPTPQPSLGGWETRDAASRIDPGCLALSDLYLWDQPEEGSLGTPLSLEEQVLNSTFEACDPQRTGIVAVTHVVAYLETVTGRGPQDACLQTLARSLDPSGEGPRATVDLDTFLAVMRDWIAACQLDGGLELEEESAFEGALIPQELPSGCPEAEELANLESFGGEEDPRPELPATADLLSSLEDLELSNRRLAGENAKLQRSVETAEEGTARLSEEIAALRKQLRSAQQALQFAKAVDEELEDLKTLAKSLEEQNRSLLAQARQAEKEQQHLVAKMETLQEENGKLLAECDGVKRRSEELATEKEALKWQLYECECLICQREAILSERTRHAESLAKSLEEYKATTQELRLEISHLEEQLIQTHEGPDELPEGAQARRVGWTKLLPPSLGSEIEAIQQKQDMAAAADLSSPLCGVWQWEEVVGETDEEAAIPPEAPPGGQRNFQEEPVHPQEEWSEHCMWLPRREEEEEAEALVPVDLPIPMGASHLGNIPESPPESPAIPEPNLHGALVPVPATKELGQIGRRHRGQLGLPCLPPQQFRVTRHPLVPAPFLGLVLLLLLSVLLLGQSPPPSWPHLQLSYLQSPPV